MGDLTPAIRDRIADVATDAIVEALARLDISERDMRHNELDARRLMVAKNEMTIALGNMYRRKHLP